MHKLIFRVQEFIARAFRSPLDRQSFEPNEHGGVDQRTLLMPMIVNDQAKNYYDVVNEWTAEKMRAKILINKACNGAANALEFEGYSNSYACEFGTWLRFVFAPQDKTLILEDLKMWHDVWHAATEESFHEARSGRLQNASAIVNNRKVGSWAYSARRVDRLLEALWKTES